MILQEITLEEISILDKKILSAAMDKYGQGQFTLWQATGRQPYLKEYSIAQSLMYGLYTNLNRPKVWNMVLADQKKRNKKLKLEIHTALTAIDALQEYSNMSEPYEKSSALQMIQKLNKQLV